jgi:integrase/recombinase XerD
MPIRLDTVLKKVERMSNRVNSDLLKDFYQHMKDNGTSENYQKGNLKALVHFSEHIGPAISFYDVDHKEVIRFLDSKMKSEQIDSEKKWIITWNDYLWRLKLFFRWLHNKKIREINQEEVKPEDEWKTPSFLQQIKKKKTKRLSPYIETEIWDRDELLTVVKYELYIRNKAALTLFWDLDARNHEVTMLKIKHIRLRERYGEGEVPHEAKTGGGPILLTCSFPYVRDWLNNHPFRNSGDARLICNLHNGSQVKPEAMNTMMKQLKKRIERLLETGEIKDPTEQETLEYLLKTKKWNPYCIRHSAITYDSDSLPEFALKKKVRWSMNSKQPSRYIKRRMGNNLKNQILVREGIIVDEETSRVRPSVIKCPRCTEINAFENKLCFKCSYPLSPQAYEEIKSSEDERFRCLEQRNEETKNMLKTVLKVLANMDDESKKRAAKDLVLTGVHKAGGW